MWTPKDDKAGWSHCAFQAWDTPAGRDQPLGSSRPRPGVLGPAGPRGISLGVWWEGAHWLGSCVRVSHSSQDPQEGLWLLTPIPQMRHQGGDMPPATRQWPIRAGSELNELKHSTCVIVPSPEPLSSVIFYLEYFVEFQMLSMAKGCVTLWTTKKEKTPPIKLWHRALSLIIFILYLFKELF